MSLNERDVDVLARTIWDGRQSHAQHLGLQWPSVFAMCDTLTQTTTESPHERPIRMGG